MGMFRRMGLLGILSAIGLAKRTENNMALEVARAAYLGGYGTKAHGWGGKRRPVKGWQKQTGRRSKAQRRARAA